MTEPVALHAVTVATSTVRHDVQRLAAQVGLDDDERQRLRDGGLLQVPVATVDLEALVSEVLDGLAPADCRAVVFTHSLELDDGLLDRLTKALGSALPDLDVAPLIVSGRPCSIIHLGIQLGMRLWQARRHGTVVVIGGDVAASHADRFFFGSAMGDAAVGLTLGGSAQIGQILATASTWHVIAADGTASPTQDIARFRDQNPTAIRAVIGAALAEAGLRWSELNVIIPHSPYRGIWDTVAALCQFPRERVLDQDIGATGHLNSNDVVVHLAAAVRDGRLRHGEIAALVSPGFGATRGCTLLRVS